jgi:putative ABC transport system permease protein
MNLLTIALRSIRQRLLSSSLTALSVALGVALMIAVLILNGTMVNLFGQQSVGYDRIIGPKGSATQLVLSTIYRIDRPIENLPWRYYLEWKNKPEIEYAIPVALGDLTELGKFPIVGTTVDYFRIPYTYDGAKPKPFSLSGELPGGPWDAVIGSDVARTNNWGIGAQFKMIHAGQDDHVHDELFTVRGILARTDSPNDRSVFVNLEGFFLLAGHEKPIEEAIRREADFYREPLEEAKKRYAKEIVAEQEHANHGHSHEHGHDHGPVPDIQREVTSILVVAKEDPDFPHAVPLYWSETDMKLQKGYQAQSVSPVAVMSQIMRVLVGNIRLALMVLTTLIILVSGIGIFVSIYNSMSERRREIGIMRALGARRSTVLQIILTESILLCIFGFLGGLVLGHGLIFFGAPFIESRSGLVLDRYAFNWMELTVFPAILLLASLVGIVPGLTAYRTDVAEALSH